jgi:hypothetical protein
MGWIMRTEVEYSTSLMRVHFWPTANRGKDHWIADDGGVKESCVRTEVFVPFLQRTVESKVPGTPESPVQTRLRRLPQNYLGNQEARLKGKGRRIVNSRQSFAKERSKQAEGG